MTTNLLIKVPIFSLEMLFSKKNLQVKLELQLVESLNDSSSLES